MGKDIYGLLHADHQRVIDLFDEAAFTGNSELSKLVALYRCIREHMRLHCAVEEEVLYPLLRQEKQTEKLATDALAAHDKMDSLIEELDQLDSPGQPGWPVRFQKLRALFIEHIGTEEGDIFPYLRRVFPEAEVRSLAPRFEQARDRIRREMAAA